MDFYKSANISEKGSSSLFGRSASSSTAIVSFTICYTNERTTEEMKKKLEPLIEEYNQKHK